MITDAMYYRNLGSPAAIEDTHRRVTYAAIVDFIRSEYEDGYRRPAEKKITNRFLRPLPNTAIGVVVDTTPESKRARRRRIASQKRKPK